MKLHSPRGDSEDMPRFLRKFPTRRSRNVVSNSRVVEIRMQSPHGVPLKETMCVLEYMSSGLLIQKQNKSSHCFSHNYAYGPRMLRLEGPLESNQPPAASDTHPLFR